MTNIFFRAAVVALALLIASCANDGVAGDKIAKEKEAKEKADAAIPVEVANPIRGEMLAMYSGTATLEARCGGDGSCGPLLSQSCAPFLCDGLGIACNGDCNFS